PSEAIAIAFQKGNPAFQGLLDRALDRIRADGRLSALSEKWFGVDASNPLK
ncbi:MAG: ABC-type amino acid transport/signal transduction system, periplasmic component/domain, partial [Pseudomonas sp.]|nr:ABC-type amino acid transport/signal transduction system, periplasmic component/domain [Pseudomonas sp.]